MARLECSRGWGAVRDPETGRDISLSDDTEVDDDVARRLADRYQYVTAVIDDSDDADDDADTDDEDDGDELRCGVNGCSREVDSPDAACWQHS